MAVSAAGVFGVAWLGPTGNVLYNAVDAAGMLQNAADVPVVPAASGITFATPRLAAVGSDLMLAYGRRGSTGARAAAVRLAARTGAVTGAEIVGRQLHPRHRAARDRRRRRQRRRHARRGDQPARRVDRRDAGERRPVQRLAGADHVQRAGAAVVGAHDGYRLAPGRALPRGRDPRRDQRRRAHSRARRQRPRPGRAFTFTAAPDLPIVGSGAATVAIAAVGGGIAVAWLDAQSCSGCTTREVFLATLDANGNRLGEVQVSAPSTATKSFPHIAYDGVAIAVAWLEFTSITDSQIKLRRFDTARVPVAPAMNIGQRGTAALGDVGLAVAGVGDYGVAFGLSGGTQTLAHVTCAGN